MNPLKHKGLWITLGIYSLICLSLFMLMDISISNGYARSVSAAYIEDSIKTGQLSYDHLFQGEENYKIFSGIADWPPLQVMLLVGSFLLFGINKFAFTIVPLLITLACLVYVYFLTLFAYKDKKTALLAVVITTLSALFFFEAASPMLENGLALFTLAAIYHLINWLKESNNKHFYFLCAAIGLGLLWKLTMVLVIPSLFIGFVLLKGSKKVRLKNTLLGLLLIVLILSPMIVRDYVLHEKGIDQTVERNFGRLHYLAPQGANLPGYLTAQDLEFQNGLNEQEKSLVDHRYELSYTQKGFIAFTSLFYDFVLLVPYLIYVYVSWKTRNDIEFMLLLFIVVNIVFYTLHGLIPRYMIPATVCLAILCARGLMGFAKKEGTHFLSVITISGLILSSTHFIIGVHNNEHVQSKQYDYELAVQQALINTTGNFTIQTYRPYQMSFYLLKHDTERRGRIDFIDGNKAWNDSFVYEVKQ